MRFTWVMDVARVGEHAARMERLVREGNRVFLAVRTRSGRQAKDRDIQGVCFIPLPASGEIWPWLPPSDVILTDDPSALGEASGTEVRLLDGSRAEGLEGAERPRTYPTISLCVIARNEASMIGRCLRSAIPVADEMIVVDTGSTDRTREIARSLGAKVYDLPWSGDFSKARNFALSHASGDWILCLDADEELEARDVGRLLRLVDADSREEEGADGYCLEEVSYVGKAPGRDGITHPTCRLFLNRPWHRFQARIHEQVASAIIARGGRIRFAPVRIHHYGYLDSLVFARKKPSRNLSILEEEVRVSPENSFSRYNLGCEYLRIGRLEEALSEFKESFRLLPPSGKGFDSILVHRMTTTLFLMGRHRDALRVAEAGAHVHPDYVDLRYMMACCHLKMGNYERAAAEYERCLEMGRSSWRHPSLVGAGTYLAGTGLAQAYRHMGNQEKALEALVMTAKDNPGYVLGAAALADGFITCGHDAERSLSETEGLLEGQLEEHAEVMMCMAVSERGYPEASLKYLRRRLGRDRSALRLLAMGEMLLRLRRLPEALEAFDEASGSLSESSSASFVPGPEGAALEEPFKYDSICRFNALAGGILCCLGLGDVEACEKRISALRREAPGDHLAEAFQLLLRKPETADPLAEEVCQSAWQVAGALAKYGMLEHFEVLAGHLLNRSGSEGEIRLRLAEILRSAGHLLAAASHDLEALRSGYCDSKSLVRLGEACECLGNREDALVFYKKALDLDPDDAGIYMALGKALLAEHQVYQALSVALEGIRRNPGHSHLKAIRLAAQAMIGLSSKEVIGGVRGGGDRPGLGDRLAEAH